MNNKTCHDYMRRVVYRVGGNKRKGAWTRHDTRYLKNIIKYMPHLYVFEITERMRIMSGHFWSQSYIYKNLRKLGWSLQVVFERARQIDLQERANYKYALHHYLKHPRQLITLDETSREKKTTMRRRCWSVVGKSPYLDFFWVTWQEVFGVVCSKH